MLLERHDAVLNAVPRLGGPRVVRDAQLLFPHDRAAHASGRVADLDRVRDHLQVVVRAEGDHSARAFDRDERLRVRRVVGEGLVTRVSDRGGARHAHEDRGDILTGDARVHAERLGIDRLGLADEETG